MVKIINGKLYDTNSATHIASYRYCDDVLDPAYWCEGLYRKLNCEFFLHGSGGPLSKYCSFINRSRRDGERIIPLTDEEAKKWLERYADAASYISVFGDPEE